MGEIDVYNKILDSIEDGVYFVDTDRKITYFNVAAEEITGFKKEEVVGTHCFDNFLNHVDETGTQLCLKGCPLQKTLQTGKPMVANLFLHHKDGYRKSVTVKTFPVFDDNHAIIGAVEAFSDDRKFVNMVQSMNSLKNIAFIDELTGLPNRRYIKNELKNRIALFNDLGMKFSAAMIDIDFFKKVNDTYGHDAGDEVLKMVASAFKSLTRKNDLIGRWGGEEFVGIFLNEDEESLDVILERIRMLVERSGLRYETSSIQVTVSIGGATVLEGDDVTSLVKRIDDKLYEAKHSGRNCVKITTS